MFNFRIRGMRVASHFGSGVGYGPCGAVGQGRVESAPWREGMRVAEEPECGASGRGAD